MVTEKTIRYTNRNLNLEKLSRDIVDYLNEDGYATQREKGVGSILIQAQKEDILRDIFTADRCFSILIQGQPNDFTVQVGIGRWVQNLTVAALEAAISAGLFLLLDIPEMAWNEHIENKIIKGIGQIIEDSTTNAESQEIHT
jgi:hypothetical protein